MIRLRICRTAFASMILFILISCANQKLPKYSSTSSKTMTAHYRAFASENSQPPSGYGLYSYVVAKNSSDQSVERLATVIRSIISEFGIPQAREDLSGYLKINANVFVLTVKDVLATKREINALSDQPTESELASLVRQNYTFPYFSSIDSDICAGTYNGSILPCAGQGPFIMSFDKPYIPGSKPVYILDLGIAERTKDIPKLLESYINERSGAGYFDSSEFTGKVISTIYNIRQSGCITLKAAHEFIKLVGPNFETFSLSSSSPSSATTTNSANGISNDLGCDTSQT